MPVTEAGAPAPPRQQITKAGLVERLGRSVCRYPRAVILATIGASVIAALWGTQVFGHLVGGGFEDPRSQSSLAARTATSHLGRETSDVQVLYRAPGLTVDDPRMRRAVEAVVARLPPSAVERAVSYYNTGSADLVSADRRATFVGLALRGDDDRERRENLALIETRLDAPGLHSQVGGTVALDRDINERSAADLRRAEMVSAPLLATLLVVIFGGLVAASLPLVIGAITTLGSLAALRALTEITEVSVYAVNIATLLGLGLAIDYGFLIVTRFRQELHRAPTVTGAVTRTMATAGRTAVFSGTIVTASLSSLLIFPQPFLRSLALGAITSTLIAVATVLLVLPALLRLLGPKVDALRLGLPSRRPRRTRAASAAAHTGPVPGETGTWRRIAVGVMRHPVLYALAGCALLICLGLPFRHVEFGGIDYRVLPAATESRQVGEIISRDFTAGAARPVQVILTLPRSAAGPGAHDALQRHARRIHRIDGVTGVRTTGKSGNVARLTVAYSAAPFSPEARRVVHRIRDLPAPQGGRVLVGGRSAELTDLLAGLRAKLPWMVLIIAVVTFVLMMWIFESVLLPIKALVMNTLSLSASFGALVWIFQDGHLSGLLDFTPTGNLDATMPILVLAVVFGLSMDYEVFLLSRIREHYDATGDTHEAIASGLQHTGKIITSAALLLIVVTAAFSLSGVTVIKLIGVAVALAVAIDATVVRIILVPATMSLLGNANWWTPRLVRQAVRAAGPRR